MHNILIISDQAPSIETTAGNVLVDIFDTLGECDVNFIILHDEGLDYSIYEKVSPLSLHTLLKPNENWKNSFFPSITSFFGELLANIDRQSMSKLIIDWINRITPTKILFVLESQSSVIIANNILKKIDVPYVTISWDPLSWWLDERKVHQYHKRKYRQILKNIFKNAEINLTPTRRMAEDLNAHNNYKIFYPVSRHDG